MLKEWFRGSGDASKSEVEVSKPQRMVVDAEKSLETPESKAERRRALFEAKLAESAKETRANANRMVSYDSIFRRAQSILLEGNNNETQQGLVLNLSGNFQNTMMSSKWTLVNPDESNFELNLQMNGFSDVIGASWSTLNRYQLMYQRMSSTGAVIVTQFMAQKQQGMCQGMVFAMLQYPWVTGGCTQLQYVKDQNFSISHFQRLIRGVHAGSNLAYNCTTRESNLSYAMSLLTPKHEGFVAEICPSKGTWKVAATGRTWEQNIDCAVELEFKEGRESKKSSLNLGFRKSFVGGAELIGALTGFHTLKVNLTLPFGGAIQGLNQLRLLFNCEYDVHRGALKQGLVLTA